MQYCFAAYALPCLCAGVDVDVAASVLACMSNSTLVSAAWAAGARLDSDHVIDVLASIAAHQWDTPAVLVPTLLCMADVMCVGAHEVHTASLVMDVATDALLARSVANADNAVHSALAAMWACLQSQVPARIYDPSAVIAIVVHSMADHMQCGDVVEAGAGCLRALLFTPCDDSPCAVDQPSQVWDTLIAGMRVHGCRAHGAVWSLLDATRSALQVLVCTTVGEVALLLRSIGASYTSRVYHVHAVYWLNALLLCFRRS
jgi:hypothetical protein